jgi:hypothetical protein
MSYQTDIEDMVGRQVARYQAEMLLAKQMREISQLQKKLPYGYPNGVYHPMHICRTPRCHQFVAQTGGRLSNGVPRILSAEIVNQYPLGVYCPLMLAA